MNKKLLCGGLLATAMLMLSACGGSSDDDDKDTVASKFTQTATWSVILPASGESLCYDFDAKAEVSNCTGTDWDLMLVSSGRTGSLYTNSGASGSGDGAALGGPFDYTWTALQALTEADADADDWTQDSLKTVFTGANSIKQAAFEYGYVDLGLTTPPPGVHTVFPNYRTFLITTDNTKTYANGIAGQDGAKVFALQFTNYSAPAFRFADRTLAVNTDADTSNDVVQTSPAWTTSTDWVYYDLINNQKVTPATDNWHIAILKSGQNFSIKTNGGVSGTGGKVGSYLGKTPSGFYSSGSPVAAKFQEAQAAVDAATPTTEQTELLTSLLGDLTLDDTLTSGNGGLSKPSSANAWVKDNIVSALNPDYTGSYPDPLDYGWLTYYPTTAAAATVGLVQHQIKANPENGTLLRSGEGNSYARFHLKQVSYATPTDSNSQQTWTFEFEIQPSAE